MSLRRSHRYDRGPVEEGALGVFGDLQCGQLQKVFVDLIDLGQGHHAVGDAEKIQNAQVLLRLRLPALGRGHDEDAAVDRAHPGQHVAQESDVSWHVDQRHRAIRREGQAGEAEVDGESPLLLLGPTIGVGAGECPHQGGLAMVDMARRRQNRHGLPSAAASAETTHSSSASSIVRRSTIVP